MSPAGNNPNVDETAEVLLDSMERVLAAAAAAAATPSEAAGVALEDTDNDTDTYMDTDTDTNTDKVLARCFAEGSLAVSCTDAVEALGGDTTAFIMIMINDK